MAVVAVFQGPTLTQQQYEQSINRLTGGKKNRMESPTDWPVEGLLAHIAGPGQGGFRVVDVWDSEDSFRRFGDQLMPILRELGIDVQPDIYPAYAFVSA
jgi:hypothetical protein